MYTTRDLMQITGVTRKMLRDFDSMGILCPAVKPNKNGQRWLYDDDSLSLLFLIIIFSECGYRRSEIKPIIESYKQDKEVMSDKIVDDLEELLKRLQEKERKIADMRLFLEKIINQTDEERERRNAMFEDTDLIEMVSNMGGFTKLLPQAAKILSGQSINGNSKPINSLVSRLFMLSIKRTIPPDSDMVQNLVSDIITEMSKEMVLPEGFIEKYYEERDEEEIPEDEVRKLVCLLLLNKCLDELRTNTEQEDIMIAKGIFGEEGINFLEDAINCHLEKYSDIDV